MFTKKPDLKCFAALIAVSIFSSCGSNNPPPPPAATPQTIDSLTPEQKAKVCFTHVDAETAEIRASFLKKITGYWVNYPASTSAGYDRREFRFDLDASIAAVTKYYDIGSGVEDITFKKLCVSKQLDASYGVYAGFRLIEMMANNNEGGAAVFVKLDDNGTSETLSVSDRHYERWATDKYMDPMKEIVNGGQIKSIWIYREHKK